jgi:hypothetical protein
MSRSRCGSSPQRLLNLARVGWAVHGWTSFVASLGVGCFGSVQNMPHFETFWTSKQIWCWSAGSSEKFLRANGHERWIQIWEVSLVTSAYQVQKRASALPTILLFYDLPLGPYICLLMLHRFCLQDTPIVRSCLAHRRFSGPLASLATQGWRCIPLTMKFDHRFQVTVESETS